MNELFTDTVYYSALLNPRDQHHAAARQAAIAIHQPIVTTIWVLMEVADALSHSSTRLRAHRFVVDEQDDSSITVISDLEPWWTRGLALYANRPDKDWSLTDCISFEVMSTRGITDALTADHHFTQACFRALLLPGD